MKALAKKHCAGLKNQATNHSNVIKPYKKVGPTENSTLRLIVASIKHYTTILSNSACCASGPEVSFTISTEPLYMYIRGEDTERRRLGPEKRRLWNIGRKRGHIRRNKHGNMSILLSATERSTVGVWCSQSCILLRQLLKALHRLDCGKVITLYNK